MSDAGRSGRALALALSVSVSCCASACGPQRRPDDPTGWSDSEREYHRGQAGGGGAVRVGGGDAGFAAIVVGGRLANDRPGARAVTREGDASVVAVSADAGVLSAEMAWMVAHIADPPDPANPVDTMNVRALAERGADGVRAVAPVLRRGDARRVPYARRVIERVALRACRRWGGRDGVVRLIPWLELGRVPPAAVNDAGVVVWTRDDATLWPAEAIARLLAWADAGMPCGPAVFDGGALARDADATAPLASSALDASSRTTPTPPPRFDAGATDR